MIFKSTKFKFQAKICIVFKHGVAVQKINNRIFQLFNADKIRASPNRSQRLFLKLPSRTVLFKETTFFAASKEKYKSSKNATTAAHLQKRQAEMRTTLKYLV